MKYLLLIHQGDSPTPRDPEGSPTAQAIELTTDDGERRLLAGRLADLDEPADGASAF